MTSCKTEIGAQEQSPISTEVLKIDNDQQNKEGRTIFGKKVLHFLVASTNKQRLNIITNTAQLNKEALNQVNNVTTQSI